MSQADVVVVGAGITGLTCAYRLQKLGIKTLVLESGNRVGGVIRSERINGHLVEWGPTSLLPTPHTFSLLEELGLDDTLQQANPKSPRYVVVRGRLRVAPLGPLSVTGILRGMAEPFIRSKSQNDESVARFFRRRFGSEIHDRLVAPFVTGIFAGNTESLSVGAVFPRVLDIEREHGSVVWGMLTGKGKRKANGKNTPQRRSTISSFPEGMEVLPRRIAAGLTIQTQCSGVRIGRDVQARATVLAVPAYVAAEILADTHPEVAALLGEVEYAPVVVATTSIPLDSLQRPLDGFGFLVPQSERLAILGTIFSSLLFSGRAPQGRLLLTSFLGGVNKPEVFDWPDERIWESVGSELKRILKTSLRPEPVAIFRHRRAIPQYNIGHRQRVDAIASELARIGGLFVTGNFLHGVSVPACMEHGDNTATAVSEFLRNS
ncbi:MAG TPA: protoporphyrinogen oxidase [Terriglobia bacterium]|nr:protoporphyrinogen oxidase [Terriglobia bacterium]